MRSRRALLVAACCLALAPALAEPGPFPFPREPVQPVQPAWFTWSGSLAGAARALAARLGYRAWETMASGLPLPDPPPRVVVSVAFPDILPVAIVEELNRRVARRAVVVPDPDQRFIGVVYYD